MRADTGWLETATGFDRFYNYCFWEYQPRTPAPGKLTAANLLYHSFEAGKAHENAFQAVQLVREAIGTGNTVWGIKWLDGKLKWEFYVYDYRRRDRERSISRIVRALSPIAASTVPMNEFPHYFMFSIDIDDMLLSGGRDLDEIHMYVGNSGSTVSSGISYSVRKDGNRLENLYYFFNAKEHRDDIIGKICCSAFLDSSRIDLDSILWPDLSECRTICLANKQYNDCIYFSGITVEQLLTAMHRLNYPESLVAFIRDNRSKLDHLYYDFGIDYRLRDGRMEVVKSGYYGTF